MNTSKLLQHAIALHQKGDLKNARIGYQKILKIRPSNSDALHLMGVIELQEANNIGAINLISEAIKINPKNAEYYCNLGVALTNHGIIDIAIENYKKALKLNNKYPDAYNNLGNALKSMGLIELAIKNYESAIYYNGKYAEAYNNLGLALHSIDENLKSVENLEKAIALKPHYYEALSNIGGPLLALGLKKEAIECCKKSISINNKYPKSFNNLAVALASEKNFNDAEIICRQLIISNPTYFEAYVTLSNILTEQGRLNDALNILGEIYNNGIQNTSIAIAAGLLSIYLDDFELAKKYFGDVTSISNSKNLEANIWLSVIAYIENQIEISYEFLQASNEIVENSNRKLKSVRGYKLWLDQLVAYKFSHVNEKKDATNIDSIYVIGESHSFSFHNEIVRHNNFAKICIAKWIVGCKQWHLANSENNKHKQMFMQHINNIPSNSTILIAIGEIDTREDEGFIKYCNSNKLVSFEEIIENTVFNFCKYVINNSRKFKHNVIFSGVPAPVGNRENKDSLTLGKRVNVIKNVNFYLRKFANQNRLEFLDIYQLTNRGDGLSNEIWHMDDYHLKPIGVVQAFKENLIKN